MLFDLLIESRNFENLNGVEVRRQNVTV